MSEIHLTFVRQDPTCANVIMTAMAASGRLYQLHAPEWSSRWDGDPLAYSTMEITLDGLRTVVLVNGVKVTDYTEGQPVGPRKFTFEPFRGPRPREGYFGLQNHGEHDVVFFKEVAFKKLR